MNRETIYAKDIQVLTGKCLKTSRNILRQMRIYYKKKSHQFITSRECAEYLGIPLDVILNLLSS